MRSDPEAPTRWGELNAPAPWRTIDFISDLHLQAGDPATAQAFRRYLQDCQADALFILGDLFEVWIGDDLLDASPAERTAEPEYDFLAGICTDLRAFSARQALYVMHGNRDFLLGVRFAAASGATLLDDPTLLRWGEQRVLLSHGDAWCLGDGDYLEFRAQVRSPGWQAAFLQRPLAERASLARGLRAASEARKQDPAQDWADVDAATATAWLQASDAATLVHGHTHRPGRHELGDGRQRLVLSDWEAEARPARAEALRLDASGRWQRIGLAD
ncbi:UDP-2,3-diacylglucosamine diphosphatase [Malikia granosa]|uniref:UDP-2,3-diacylglucosamine hydrolase n=1 Tax=Malikia granosa TaxID=263067 RepID=A0A2S9K7L4_9BURK|nr:UDP-2,3-diacylglucosamine diphosphatase [Malikia granosa]PRD66421.1 UDP-2,3-diacylglucosamine diphosphatase [Malikia granosa]